MHVESHGACAWSSAAFSIIFWKSPAHEQAGTPPLPLVPDEDPEEPELDELELLDEELEVEPLLEDALGVLDPASLVPEFVGAGSDALVSSFCGAPSLPGGMSEPDSAQAETAAATRTRPVATRAMADFIAVER